MSYYEPSTRPLADTDQVAIYQDGHLVYMYGAQLKAYCGGGGGGGGGGTPGVGIASSAVTYQASSSGTTVPTGAWSASIPSVPKGQYLWTRTTFTMTDATTQTAYSSSYQGADGSTSVGVASSATTYQAAASGTTAPTGTWTSSVPAITKGQYLWTRVVLTLTDASTNTSYSVGYQGADGTNGAAGSKWYTGSGAPAAGFASPGDYYIDRTSALQTYYNKADATTWNVVGSLKGDTGPAPAVSTVTFYQSSTGWTSAPNNTTVQTLTSVLIPANTMQANSRMEIITEWSITGTVATKTLGIIDNATGTMIQNTSGAFAGSGYYSNYLIVSNRGAQNSQFIRNVSTNPWATSGANGVAPLLTTFDFTVDRTLNFTAQFGTSVTETIKLEAYQVRIWTP